MGRGVVTVNGSLSTIEGAPAVGQAIALGLSDYFADFHDPEGVKARLLLQGAPKPRISTGSIEEFSAQTLWEMENQPELCTVDPREMSVDERIQASIQRVSEFLDGVLDVRFNGRDVEIDYCPTGHDTHVLRIDGLIPEEGRPFAFNSLPIRRSSLITVEDLSHRLFAHLKHTPEFVHQIHWRTFERLIAEILEVEGWEILKLTRGSKDGGVDIYAARPGDTDGSTLAVIDCKKYRGRVGVDRVRSIAGLKLQHNASVGILITTSYFTAGARDLERNQLREHVKLHDFTSIKSWLTKHRWKQEGELYLPESRFSRKYML